MDLAKLSWKNLLIKGKHGSGKSELTLWIVNKILKFSQEKRINRLLDDRERVLLLTEKIDQVELIEMNLDNKIHIVEHISSKDPLEYIKTYHENYGIELLVLDYLNLFEHSQKVKSMPIILDYLEKNEIRWIFVEHTYKLLREDLKVEKIVDCILHASRNADGIEVSLTKENGKNLPMPLNTQIKIQKT